MIENHCTPTRRKTPGVEGHLGSRSQGFCFSLPHTIRVEQDQLCLSSMGQQELYLNILSFHPFHYKNNSGCTSRRPKDEQEKR